VDLLSWRPERCRYSPLPSVLSAEALPVFAEPSSGLSNNYDKADQKCDEADERPTRGA